MNEASSASLNGAPRPERNRFPPAIAVFLLFALTFVVFFPSIRNDFLVFDDADYVTANRHVQEGLTGRGFLWACTSVAASNWHPLTWLSHMLDCQVYGLRPWGHHLTSVLLHALNAALLFLLLRRMTGSTWRSFLVAALFGLHPLRVESVAWIAERKDVLSGMFWMLTLWAYANYVSGVPPSLRFGAAGRCQVSGGETKSEARNSKLEACGSGRGNDAPAEIRNPSRVWYGCALVFFALGLMCKPMLVTLPCVLLLLDFWPLKRWTRESAPGLVREKAPFFLAAIAVSWITFAVQREFGSVNLNVPFAGRLANAAISYWRYLGTMFWPADLTLAYPYPPPQPLALVLAAGAMLAALSLAAFFLRRRFPAGFVGWFWFAGTLVPVIGIIQVGAQSMADRYTYLPSIGIAWLIVWGVAEWSGNRRWQSVLLAAGAATVLALCSSLTWRQIRCWRDDATLFRHALQVTRNNYVAHFCLGAALHRQGDLEGALAQYRQSLAIDPTFPSAHDGLGLLLLKRDDPGAAVRHLREASQRRPKQPLLHYHLGLALERAGDAEGARMEYQRALELQPELAEAHNELAVLCGRLGRLEEAAGHSREAARLQPRHAEFRYNFGNALVRIGRLDEAIAQLLEAVRLDPGHCDAHNNLGVLLTRKGRWGEAAAQFQIVLQLKPDHAEAHRNLQAALGRLESGRTP